METDIKASSTRRIFPSDRISSAVTPPPPQSEVSFLSFLSKLNSYDVSYSTCVFVFVFVGICVALLPLKEFFLGSYITKTFDGVTYDIVARQLNQLGVIISGVHFYEAFCHSNLPLIDNETSAKFNRASASKLPFSSFLVRANIRRADLLANLPTEILTLPVDTMNDVYAPLCGPNSSYWETPPQLLFGHWFPTIRHEFCRDFNVQFPRDRFFNYNTKAPIDQNLTHISKVTLGLIAVVNMSEVYLRQFADPYVIRKIMKNVQEGFLGIELPNYTDAAAEAIVHRYRYGIPLADVIALLPGSFDSDHVALVDVLSIRAILDFYLVSQQLTMGININAEPAILAEVTHAVALYMSPDFLINTVGMHYVSTVHLAPFWACAIKHTTMSKNIKVADVNATAIKQCGNDLETTLPAFIVNLMYLFQPKQRDYDKIDNTTAYILGRRRESDPDYVPLIVPETFEDSALLSMDGSAWIKDHKATQQVLTETPYGYLYTPDCRNLVDDAMQQSGRNVQKYQAYLGDGLGNCAFRDSQETTPQTLCRLFMTADDLLFRSLDGTLVTLPTCSSLLSEGVNAATLALEQENLRQVEWFMVETTMLSRRVRIQDNTSRQIRTFLLLLNLVGATLYSIHYVLTLRSVWAFISNSVYRSAASLKRIPEPQARFGIINLLLCDPADGALLNPVTMVLLYLGAVGSLSNIFSLDCSAKMSATEGNLVIHCAPSVPLSSRWLVFTTLSSSYWVLRISLQSRTLCARVTHALRPDLLRFWLFSVFAMVAIHYFCKGTADLLSQNVKFRFDPHLYAICCSFLLTVIISGGSLLVQMVTTAYRRRGLSLARRSSGPTTLHLENDGGESDRKFEAKWCSGKLHSVLHYCATSQIARQLDLARRRRIRYESRSRLVLVPSGSPRDTPIRIQEFVIVHCAAGAHVHLKRVKWSADGGVASIDGPRGTSPVVCADEVNGTKHVQVGKG